ncbi:MULTISPECIES: DUF4349 domain-containing protein [Paenibacillus]|uniref:DUF4349 domain-containing protein n=1 Tax=Paenibacillus naphthalenovorans TaxID=162209 RepID=A0A0U2MUY5_9BACL|nr:MULTISPECIES: DUF4349 domain-containing protein [Paenibacillus]ALS21359.1 hypothetical protein IJ22_09770 [Paenibacillus naphthalenovorans]NTZ18478.1 DUF4349 domain-containing protein [Paenibacillus sp. JMULE4]GCL72617.1 DUF4349 domain-containing protein [Paenibacillus naphthalenovorans]
MRSEKEWLGRTARTSWNRLWRGMALSAVLAALLAGCSASNDPAASSSSAASGHNQAADAKASPGAVADSQANTAGRASEGQEAGGPAAETALAAEPFSRKIIYTANLVMQVENYEEAESRVQEAVKQSGAYILQFNENTSSSEKYGIFTIKVPANGFQSLLDLLEKINPSMQKNMQGQDVTEEYVDLTARLKAKQVMEGRLVAFMEKAEKTDELVAFSNELGKVQEEIERIQGRMRYLEQNVAYSTIELRITQKIGSAEAIKAQERGPLMERAAAALNGTATMLGFLFQWVIVIVAGALPVLLLLALAIVPVYLMRRRRKARLEEIRARLSEHNQLQEPKNE